MIALNRIRTMVESGHVDLDETNKILNDIKSRYKDTVLDLV